MRAVHGREFLVLQSEALRQTVNLETRFADASHPAGFGILEDGRVEVGRRLRLAVKPQARCNPLFNACQCVPPPATVR